VSLPALPGKGSRPRGMVRCYRGLLKIESLQVVREVALNHNEMIHPRGVFLIPAFFGGRNGLHLRTQHGSRLVLSGIDSMFTCNAYILDLSGFSGGEL